MLDPTRAAPDSPWTVTAAIACLAVLVLLPAGAPSATAPPRGPADLPGLAHVLALSPTLWSGAEPQGPTGFGTLRALGVTTVVSVDGAAPDLAAAQAAGLRYVHIPIGYDGVPQAAQLALARVLRESTGPIYIHCHHGKHRGPAAAAIALRLSTGAKADAAFAFMRQAKTSRSYKGLWRDVAACRPPGPDAELPELHSQMPVGNTVTAMVRMNRHLEALAALRKNGWQPLAAHPDVTPAHEAILLTEQLREAHRHLTARRDAEYARLMLANAEAAEALYESLKQPARPAADERFRAVTASCTACHQRYRD